MKKIKLFTDAKIISGYFYENMNEFNEILDSFSINKVSTNSEVSYYLLFFYNILENANETISKIENVNEKWELSFFKFYLNETMYIIKPLGKMNFLFINKDGKYDGKVLHKENIVKILNNNPIKED
jgi:hypothetical protein